MEPEPEPEPADAQPEQSLAELTADILGVLKQHKPVAAEGVDPSLHYRAPHINKQTWTALGDMIAARERSCTGSVAGERWISLRLDGSGFSSAGGRSCNFFTRSPTKATAKYRCGSPNLLPQLPRPRVIEQLLRKTRQITRWRDSPSRALRWPGEVSCESRALLSRELR